MMQAILPRKQVILREIQGILAQGILTSKQAALVMMQVTLRQAILPRKQAILRAIQEILAQGILRSRQATLMTQQGTLLAPQATLMPSRPPRPRPPPSTICTRP